MDCTVRTMTCRFGACCMLFGAELSLEDLDLDLFGAGGIIRDLDFIRPRRSRSSRMRWSYRRESLPCGVGSALRGSACRFGADCKRAKRVEEIVGMRAKSVSPTDLGDDVCAGAGGEAEDAAVAEADSGNGRTTKKKTVDKDVGQGAEAVDRRPFVFGRRRVGVARRPSAMGDAGGVGGGGGGAWTSSFSLLSQK